MYSDFEECSTIFMIEILSGVAYFTQFLNTLYIFNVCLWESLDKKIYKKETGRWREPNMSVIVWSWSKSEEN